MAPDPAFDALYSALSETAGRVFARKAARDEAEAVPYTLAHLLAVPDWRALQDWGEQPDEGDACAVPDLAPTDAIEVPADSVPAFEAAGYMLDPDQPADIPDRFARIRVASLLVPSLPAPIGRRRGAGLCVLPAMTS